MIKQKGFWMQCKFCKANDVTPLKKMRSIYNSLDYTLYFCDSCKCYFFDINEHDYDLRLLYDSLGDKNISSYDVIFKKDRYWDNEKRIIYSIQPNINSILDLGCRTGDFLMHFDADVEKYGIELSKSSAEVAIKRGLNIYEEFIENIDFKDKKFDAVTCYAILEHLKDPAPILDRLTQLVEKNGVLVVMVPYLHSFKAQLLYKINFRWHMFSQPEHLNFYSKVYLDKFISEKGFVLRRIKYTSGGMFNPFKKIPIVSRVFGKFMNFIDFYTPINQIPIFDHMYLYYQKTKGTDA